jgi:Tol biopolymer transport system component
VVVPSIVMVVVMALVSCSDDGGSAPPVATGSSEAPQVQTLSIVDVGTGDESALEVPVGASAFDVTLDGSMITYVDLDEARNAQVFVMNADGSNARQLTTGEGGAEGPSWAPDGTEIAYQRAESSDSYIFVVRVASGGSTMVSKEPGAVDAGGWAPDGGSIVVSTFDASIDHWTAQRLDLATGKTTLLVSDGSTPTLSPDGAWLAFNSWLKPQVRLMVANADGAGRRLVTRLDGDDGYQRWSPDSTQIAYIGSTEQDGSGTYVYDLTTGETRFVTDGWVESWMDNDHILVS